MDHDENSEPSTNEQTSFNSANELLEVLSNPAAPESALSRADFVDQVDDIFATVQRAVDPRKPLWEIKPMSEARKIAREAYVDGSIDRVLGLQADVILSAYEASQNQMRQDELASRMRHDNDPALKQQFKENKRVLCAYNHAVRDLVLAAPDTFTRVDLVEWLEKGAPGKHGWAERLITGVAAEVAVIRLAGKNSKIADVIPASVDEDLKKIDLSIRLHGGRVVPFDVKYGGNQPLEGEAQRGSVYEIALEKGAVQGFEISPLYRASVMSDIEQGFSYRQAA